MGPAYGNFTLAAFRAYGYNKLNPGDALRRGGRFEQKSFP